MSEAPIPAAERHADDTDRAAAHADAWTARARAHHERAAASSRPWTAGVCRNCAEQPIVGCFCDDDCRADFERRQARGVR